MQNYKCDNCDLIYKKNGYTLRVLKEFIETSSLHPGGLNTLKKNFGKKKF